MLLEMELVCFYGTLLNLVCFNLGLELCFATTCVTIDASLCQPWAITTADLQDLNEPLSPRVHWLNNGSKLVLVGRNWVGHRRPWIMFMAIVDQWNRVVVRQVTWSIPSGIKRWTQRKLEGMVWQALGDDMEGCRFRCISSLVCLPMSLTRHILIRVAHLYLDKSINKK